MKMARALFILLCLLGSFPLQDASSSHAAANPSDQAEAQLHQPNEAVVAVQQRTVETEGGAVGAAEMMEGRRGERGGGGAAKAKHKKKRTMPALRVGREVQHQRLLRYGEAHGSVYPLQGLRPSLCYEVKISYPGTIGAGFHLSLYPLTGHSLEKGHRLGASMPHSSAAAAGTHGELRRRRCLLDTEKIVFCTTEQGQAEEGGVSIPFSSAAVRVWAERTGVLPMGLTWEDVNDGGPIFNIVCEELLLGLPKGSWPLMGACLVLALLSLLLGTRHRVIILYFCPELTKERKS